MRKARPLSQVAGLVSRDASGLEECTYDLEDGLLVIGWQLLDLSEPFPEAVGGGAHLFRERLNAKERVGRDV